MLTSSKIATHSALLGQLAPDALAEDVYSGVFLEIDPSVDNPNDFRGLSVTCVGFPYGTDVAPERAVEVAQRLGAPAVRIWSATMGGQTYAAAYERTLTTCEAYRSAARERGLRVLLHQRWGTLAASASQLFHILQRFDANEVACIYDAGSMTIEGYEDYRIGLEVLGSYVADVHLANTRHFPSRQGSVWDWEWSPLSDGLLDIQRLMRALGRVSYQGWLTVADLSPGPPVAALLEEDARVVRQAVADLEGIGSHNPFRPLDDHVPLAERPERG